MLLAKLVPRGPGRFLVSVCGAARAATSQQSVIQFWRKELFAETDAYFYWC